MTSVSEDRQAAFSPGLALKQAVRVASLAAVASPPSGLLTVDGIVVAEGDRVLLKNQASSIENGIWVASTGNWNRSADFDGNRDVANGTMVLVLSGSQGGQLWRVATTDPIIPDTTAIAFSAMTLFSSPTPGGVLFGGPAGAVAADAANFFWDDTNNRLGIGTNAPSAPLHVASGRVLVSGVATPRVDFSPSAGNTRTGSLTQQGDSMVFASDLANLMSLNLSTGNLSGVPTGTFSTSVVTPLVKSPTASNLVIGTTDLGSLFVVSNSSGDFLPATDNTQSFGSASARVKQVFTPIIDSGTSGSVVIKVANGDTVAEFARGAASPVNFLQVQSLSTGNPIRVIATGSDTDVSMELRTKGAGSYNFFADGGSTQQFQITRTASATRWPTVTGSNGGNVQWGSSAGGSDFTSATIRFPNIGTTASAANATLNAVGSNDLLRSTSSMRYKSDIADLLDQDLLALELVRTVRYRSAAPQDDQEKIHYGLLAENVHAINPILTTTGKLRVTENVEIDVPDWVQYERFIPLLIEQGRRDRARIAALERAVLNH